MSILIENVTKHFGNNIVLDSINLEIKTGSLVALLGGSGSGKSTLLRVVAGFEEPSTGRVWLNGKDSSSLPIQEKEIGFVFQAYALFQHLTVYENIAFGLSCNSSFEQTLFKKLLNWFSKSSFVVPEFITQSKFSSFFTNKVELEKNISKSVVMVEDLPSLLAPLMTTSNITNIPKPSVKELVLEDKATYLTNNQAKTTNRLLLPQIHSPSKNKKAETSLSKQERNINTVVASKREAKKKNENQKHRLKSIGTLRSVEELLRLVGLEDLAHRYPNQLSGGQCQRVALARALAVQPKVLLLDEPFGALDTKVRKNLRRWLRQLHERVGVTTLFVTHDHQEAMEVASEIVVLDKGRVKHSLNSPQKIFSRLTKDNHCI